MTDERFVVTGATGWLGRAFLAWLAAALGEGWRDRVTAFASGETTVTVGSHAIAVRALAGLAPADVDGAVVLHLAFRGNERAGEADFADANRAIDSAVLSALQAAAPRAVFVASSGMAREVARGTRRNAYGAAKLEQEARFLAYAEARGARVLVGRAFSLAGPHINKHHAYALSSLLLQAMAGGPVRIRAEGPVFRAYLHVHDLTALVLAELLGDGAPPGRPIDLCGPLVVEMQDVGEAAAAAVGLGPETVVRPPIDFASPSVYLGDPTIARELALRHGLRLKSFAEQVADTATYLSRLRDG